MEALAAIGLVGNIVQFVDFSGKLISKSIQLYHSYDGALAEDIEIEKATKNLLRLNKTLKDDAATVGDGALQSLSLSCREAAIDLLEALGKVKVKDRQQKWETIRKALKSVWSKEELKRLEQRLAKIKDDLNLHVVVGLREQVSQLRRDHLDSLKGLDFATKSILDAIVERQDVFQAAHEAQLTLLKNQHEKTMRNIDDTRQEIVQAVRQQQLEIAEQEQWLDKLPNATQAAFNASQKQHDPICLPNTRVSVLNEIRAWADGQDERCVYWLNGLAGTGKSTIARTIAREFFEQNGLGASFFFSKGGGDVGHAGKFFTTIAFQLAKKSLSLKNYICEAVSENNDIKDHSLRDQCYQLILQPLSRLDGNSSRSSYILVIDALDECEGESDIRTILQLLAEARFLKTVRLRVFLTSRPEIPIRHGFCQISDAAHQDFILHNISPSIVDHDISIFLKYNLRLIGQERSLDSGWPGEDVIRSLVRNASGLFIWAATACRFIREGKRFAVKRLGTILEGSSSAVTAPEKHLNEIYITILMHSISLDYTDEEKEELYGILRHMLGGLVVLLSPLSTYSFSRLLHILKEDVDQTLADLHAILDIPEDQTRPLRLHHPSFRDFLLNEKRCGNSDFWVDEKHAHRTLAENCIRLMSNSLKQDICGLDAPGMLIAEVESSRVGQCLPSEVQYACLYWIPHLQKSDAQLYDNDEVYCFLQEHFLHWLEALSWMRKASEGIHAIAILESIARTYDCPHLYTFIHDMKRFALYSRPAFEQAPLQIYCSGLIFAPTMSIIRKQFEDRMPPWMKRLPKLEKGWNALLQTLEGHSKCINAVAFSPDGKILASASDGGTVKLWDAGTGVILQTLEGHPDRIMVVVSSPDGKTLAEGWKNEIVKLWDVGTGVILQTLEGYSDRVNDVTFSPDGKVLASAWSDETIKLWDVDMGTVLQTLEGHSDCVNAVAFSPDGKILTSVSDDRTVRLWNADTGVILQTLKSHSGRVNAAVFSPDGKVLASASSDETIKLWNADTGTVLQTLEGHSNCVTAVAFSSNGKVLASVSRDETVKLWDAGTGAVLQTLEGRSDYDVNALVFMPDGKGLAFSPDGKVLASVSRYEMVKLWNADTRAVLQTLEGHSNCVNDVAFSPDGKVLASVSSDKTIKLWDAGTGTVLQTLENHSDCVLAVIFSPNGKMLASISNDKTIKLWDADMRVVLQTLEGYSGGVTAVVFSPDGKMLASGSHDKTIKLWNVDTGAVLQTLEGHSDYNVNAVAFSPDGKVLASGSSDETVRLWDVGTGAVLQTLESHSGDIHAVTFSPSGKMLASVSSDETVKLWNVNTGAILQTLEGHSDYVRAVAFSPDGKILASASGDETVKLWDASTGAVLQTLEVDAFVQTLSFSDEGTFLHTDRGLLHAASLSHSADVSQPNLSSAIFVKEQWVSWGMENMLWLPADHRPSCVAVYGSVIAIGHESGRVSIFEVSLDLLPTHLRCAFLYSLERGERGDGGNGLLLN